jgi:hypothetical protein
MDATIGIEVIVEAHCLNSDLGSQCNNDLDTVVVFDRAFVICCPADFNVRAVA